MVYNSVSECFEDIKVKINEAIEECEKYFINCAENIKQDAEKDLARIERGEAITEWVRG